MNELAPISVNNAKLPQTYAVHRTESVYFVQSHLTGAVKIGTSGDVTKRMSALSTGTDGKLQLLRVIDGGVRTEKWLHKRFSHLHVKGEWFAFTSEMMTVTPPDEVPLRPKITVRRDVRLTVSERLRNAKTLGADAGLGSSLILLTFVGTLSEVEAAELLDDIAASFRNRREI